MTRSIQALMHPRSASCVPAGSRQPWPAERRKRAELLLGFIRERGTVHPREVDGHFSHGTVRNYWRGSSNATTHLLDAMHYRGMLCVVRREGGIRIYAAYQHGMEPADAGAERARLDTLVDVAVRIYAPLPGARLSDLVRRLRFAVPQWQGELKSALEWAKQLLSYTRVNRTEWYSRAKENPARYAAPDVVRLLTPFDLVVWDRDRFELLWRWVYRFEAYTPHPKRKLGYYVLPLLWRDRVIGWSTLSVKNGELYSEFRYVESPPRDRAFKRELGEDLERLIGQ